MEWPADDQISRSTPGQVHKPIHVPTDWPLVVPVAVSVATAAALVLFPGPLDGPLCTTIDLATATLAAALAWTAMAIVREEERLNARGETLVPRRWRYDRRTILLGTAGALAEAVEGLGLLGIEAAGRGGFGWPMARTSIPEEPRGVTLSFAREAHVCAPTARASSEKTFL